MDSGTAAHRKVAPCSPPDNLAGMNDENLFERVGGLPGVEKLVEDFYHRILDDPMLAPFFAETRMENLRRMQVEFISAALGGPAVYSGRSLRDVHAGRGIEKIHLQRFVEHLMDTLRNLNLDENEINTIYSRIALHADEITGETTVDG